MKFLFWVLLCATIQAAPIDVYIIAGQSNALGGAWPPIPPTYLQNQDVLYYPNLISNQVWETNTAIPLQTNYNLWPTYSGSSYGSEMSFAYSIKKENPLAIIKVAANGTGLETRWKPELHDLYDWLVNRVDANIADLSLNYEPEIKGFIWIQGENDSGWDFWANKYETNMLSLINNLRVDLNKPDLPVLMNLMHKDLNAPAVNIVRGAMSRLDLLPNVYVSNNDDGVLFTDMVHYTPEMHIESGFRLANLLSPSADFNHDRVVNGDDLTILKGSLGKNRLGDANNDMVTNGQDFLIWQRQNNTLPVQAVPEPELLVLMLFTLFWRKK